MVWSQPKLLNRQKNTMNPSLDGLSASDFANLKSALEESAIIAITDNRGIITYANEKFCSISKYSKSELLGRTHNIINSDHHPKEFFKQMWSTISSGKKWEGEIRNRAKDGSLYWVHTTIVPFLNASGSPERYVSVRYDITERKAAEEQLRVYSKKLETSNQELQDFASIAAHDLQEPLRKIQMFSDRLQVKAKDQLPAETLDYLERMQSSARRMQTLINDLLTYSRVTTRARPFSRIDLNEILARVVSDLEVRIEQTRGTVTVDALPSIEADETQMYQLFQNLISNSLKFTFADRPPVVHVKSEVIESLGRRGPTCSIQVIDNGIGFDERYLDRIFTIFQRLHGRHEYEGTGIGLAVCRKIVDRHNGHLTAKSIIDRGSVFIVDLPVTQSGASS